MTGTSQIKAFLVGVLILGGLILAACGGEDRPNVDVIEDGTPGGTGSVSASGVGPAPTRAPGATGYQPVSNVDAYFNQTLDLRDMRALMAPATMGQPVDWAAVRAIYEQGKNVVRTDGTLRGIKAFATDAAVLAAFPNGASVYGQADFLDAMIMEPLTGAGRAQGLSDNARRQLVDKGIQVIFYGKAMQEMDSAKSRVEMGNLDNNTGASHAVDEAWGLLAGAPAADGSLPNGLLATAVGREGNFRLEGKLRNPLEDAMVAALKASQEGNRTAFNNAYAQVRGHLNAIFYLGALRYAKEIENDTTAENRAVHMAEGGTFYQAIRATVASGSSSAAQRVQAAYSRNPNEAFPAVETAAIYSALNEAPVLQALAIPAALVVRTPPS
jgi:hypothetical protein